MKISVKVKPQAKEDKIERVGSSSYVVWTKAKAIEGKANRAAAGILSEYFNVARSKISLIKGKGARDKIFTLNKGGAEDVRRG